MKRLVAPNYQRSRKFINRDASGSVRPRSVILRESESYRGCELIEVKQSDLLYRFKKAENEGIVRERHIVITGPGRSGSTLTCYLLNKLPNTVTLAESYLRANSKDISQTTLPSAMSLSEGAPACVRRCLSRKPYAPSMWAEPVPDSTKGEAGDVRSGIAVKGTYP
jgi:hypothetical protein